MKLSARHDAELCEELSRIVVGWTVKDVQGLPPRDVLLVLEPGDARAADADGPAVLRVRISADPEAPRLHLQQGRVQRHDGPQGPFFRRLEAELTGAALRAVMPVRGDRIALLEFRTANGRRAVLAELFGRRANLALLGPADAILEVLVPAPSKAGVTPRLAEGAVWRAPEGAVGDLDGPTLAEAWPAPEAAPPGRDPGRAPLSWRVEAHLGGHAEEARDDDLRRHLRQRVKRRVERTDALLRGLASKADAALEIERARQDGELLKAALGTLARGLDAVELVDWFHEGSPLRRIELDPRRSPLENVERAFARVKKLERGAATVAEELARAEARHAELTELLARIDDPAADIERVERDALARGLVEPRQVADVRKRKAPPPRRPYKTFHARSGAEIRVGRNARDNDELTLRHARGNDLWLHTADVPGSHVVLRLEHGAAPHPEDVLDAATLAVHFSPARGRERVPVHVVSKKHVSKPKGAKPGLVQLSGGRTQTIRTEADRLERLLRGEADAGGGPRDESR
ncbi:MAG: NFACT RNA binding domain-containing protein [Planctomycetota bacterium]